MPRRWQAPGRADAASPEQVVTREFPTTGETVAKALTSNGYYCRINRVQPDRTHARCSGASPGSGSGRSVTISLTDTRLSLDLINIEGPPASFADALTLLRDELGPDGPAVLDAVQAGSQAPDATYAGAAGRVVSCWPGSLDSPDDRSCSVGSVTWGG